MSASEELESLESLATSDEFCNCELWNLPPSIHGFRNRAEGLFRKIRPDDDPEGMFQDYVPRDIIRILRMSDLSGRMPEKASGRASSTPRRTKI